MEIQRDKLAIQEIQMQIHKRRERVYVRVYGRTCVRRQAGACAYACVRACTHDLDGVRKSDIWLRKCANVPIL